MPYRSLELYTLHPLEGLEAILKDHPVLAHWESELSTGVHHSRMLLRADELQGLMDGLLMRYSHDPRFRLVVSSIETTLPRPPEVPKAKSDTQGEEGEKKPRGPKRISRDELYSQLVDRDESLKLFLPMVVLSTIVAAVGLLKNSEAVIIGAMVLAPLLKPNMTLSLGTTLGDPKLVRKSIRTTFTGFACALAMAVGIGLVTTDKLLNIHEIAVRTSVDGLDILLATASGIAGALALTTGAPSSLIGVMVAVALLPPLVTTGLLLGSGHYTEAAGAAMLVATNVICVNIAGVATFLAQRIVPARMYEAEVARRATRRAIFAWAVLLAALLVLLFAQGLLGGQR